MNTKVKCEECDGKGFINFEFPRDLYETCRVCGGIGMTDWVMGITRRKKYEVHKSSSELGIRLIVEAIRNNSLSLPCESLVGYERLRKNGNL